MTDQEAVKIIIDGKSMECPVCYNTTFKSSNMFFSLIRNDSIPNEVMACTACSNVVNTAGLCKELIEPEVTEEEREKQIELILNEILPFPKGVGILEKISMSLERSYVAIDYGFDSMNTQQLEKILTDIRDFKNKKQGENHAKWNYYSST